MELLDSFIFITIVKAAVVFAVLMTTLAYLQWVERKVIAHIQVRPGPYRVGPHGLLQPVAFATPLWHGVDLCRTLALGTATPTGVLVHVAYLAGLAAVGLLLASVALRRRLRA